MRHCIRISLCSLALFQLTACIRYYVPRTMDELRVSSLPVIEFERYTPPRAESDAAAVVLAHRVRVHHRLAHGDEPTTDIDVYRALYIARPDAIDLANITVPMSSERLIVDFETRAILPDGQSVHGSRNDAIELTMFESGGSGRKQHGVLSYAFPQVRPGAVLEIRYRTSEPGWRMFYDHTLDRSLPVREASFELVSYGFLDTVSRSHGFSSHPRSRRAPGGQLSRKWSIRNVEPLVIAPFSPRQTLVDPSVAFLVREVRLPGLSSDKRRVLADWSDVAEPFAKHVVEALKPLPFDLMIDWSDIPDPEDRVRIAWQRVQSGLTDRHPVTESRNGLRSVLEIWRSRIATADERALVMYALLRHAQVPVSIVLVPLTDKVDYEASFPFPRMNDDWIIGVKLPENRRAWLDPGCLGCAPGKLLPTHQGRHGLLLNPHGKLRARLTTLPIEPQDRVPTRAVAEVEITPRGLMMRRGVWSLDGLAAATARHQFELHPLLDRAAIEVLREDVVDDIDEASSGRIVVEGADRVGEPIHFEVENALLTRTGYIDTPPWQIVSLSALAEQTWLESVGDRAEGALFFPIVPSFENEVHVRVPPKHAVISMPTGVQLDTEFGRYVLKVQSDGGRVSCRESLKLSSRDVSVSKRSAFDTFIAHVRRAREQTIVLRQEENLE